MSIDRYHRQTLLPPIGIAGQVKLAAARVLLIGCGALGGGIAEQLVRAGIGSLRLVDRDLVEWTNLQRQVLFDEQDAASNLPKSVAALRRLGRINSSAHLEPVVADVHAGNIETLMESIDLILDGTDNVETRYLINDAAVKHSMPWIYGACVGTEGRMMSIVPGRTACLRCVFPDPPAGRDLPACDTAGVLGPAAAVMGALQAAAAIRLLVGQEPVPQLLAVDVWDAKFRSITATRREDCPCCGLRKYEFLSSPADAGGISLCGRDAVQIRPAAAAGAATTLDLSEFASRWSGLGTLDRTPYFLRCRLSEPVGITLTLFPDGRLIVHGTSDIGRARSLYARLVGM